MIAGCAAAAEPQETAGQIVLGGRPSFVITPPQPLLLAKMCAAAA